MPRAPRGSTRIASIRESTSGQVTTGITNALSGVTFDSGPTVALTPNIAKPCANRPGQTVTVVLTATYNLDIPLVPGMTLNLSGNGAFRCRVNTRHRPAEKGAAMVLVMLAMYALCGAAAFTIDLGNGWQTRRSLITGTDAAALAAAQTYANGGNGCTSVAASYLTMNSPAAALTGCTRSGVGSAGGLVTVTASEPVDAYFGPVIGFNDWTVTSATSALYGPITSPTGLRPFGLCLAGSAALQGFLASPTVTTTITINYTKDHPNDCGPGGSLPGNWGTIDFNGGANSNSDTRIRPRTVTTAQSVRETTP